MIGGSSLTRVLIADDHDLAREGLRALLERAGGYLIVAEASTGEEALALAAEHSPDLALLDIRYAGGGIDGLEVARRLADTMPTLGVVLITMHDSADYLRAAIAAGARGFLAKDAARADVLAALAQVAAGGVAFPPALMRRAVSEDQAGPALAAIKRLTPREREVLTALAGGSTNKEIAIALSITPGTVKTHVERLIGKLGVRDRTQAAILATRHGIGRGA
ncbi:Two component transcriptional regulator, LuxR fam ily [Umezakia ovalisporum]|nr:Two component transcriptional regulator, LuxR fam ily [Umezakia ovalisporum]